MEAIPIELRLLFLGVLYIGTLAISRFSIRFGIPAILGVLLLGLLINAQFLGLNHEDAEALHVFSLAMLLFYAGLKTDLKAIRGFLEYGVVLAVGGVLVSSGLLGLLIWWLSSADGALLAPGLHSTMPLAAAFLIAACLGSTDAGATLSVLSQVKGHVPERLRHLLEFESAVNDPSALLVFQLVLGLGLATSQAGVASTLPGSLVSQLQSFVQQLAGGLLVGVVFGYLAKFVADRLVVDRPQLLVVAMSIAFVDYGLTEILEGSGFVAVYVTGVFMTNLNYRNPEVTHETLQEVLLPFNTMTEITIFLVFGLLVNPADLLPCLPMGLIAAAALMLVARPLSVLIFQPLSPFPLRDGLLVGWCGLRGAVPLALSYNVVTAIPNIPGLDPQLADVLAQNAQSVVFIVVMVNLLVQGLSLPLVARRLELTEA